MGVQTVRLVLVVFLATLGVLVFMGEYLLAVLVLAAFAYWAIRGAKEGADDDH